MYKKENERAQKAEKAVMAILDAIKDKYPDVYEAAGLKNESQRVHLKESVSIVFEHYYDSHRKAIELPTRLIYKPACRVDYTDVDKAIAAADCNWNRLKAIDEECRTRGSILGRYITISVADGQAVYQITCLSGDSAFATYCDVTADGYTDIILGKGNWLPLTKAKALIEGRDKFAAMWNGKKGNHDFNTLTSKGAKE